MSENPLKLKRLHHAHFWVGNAKQASFYYNKAFGFSQFAYSGLETGKKDVASYAMQQGQARLVLSSPLSPGGEMGEHLDAHGDGVRDLAFEVEDARHAFEEAVRRGAKPAIEPRVLEDDHGKVVHSAIRTYGDTIHSFYEFAGYDGPFLPGYTPREVAAEGAGLAIIDHIVGNVEQGRMEEWANFYRETMGFSRYLTFDDKDISTEYTALMSIVMSSDGATIKFPLNEPAPGKKKSQIEEYLDFYGSPGVQHIAFLTKDIISTISQLRANGVEFLDVPDTYYEELRDRVGDIKEDMGTIRDLRILVDRDDEGYLLQLFTKPIEDRPTVFFEIIQRAGSRGFGKGNFKALFEAIEREQMVRGTL